MGHNSGNKKMSLFVMAMSRRRELDCNSKEKNEYLHPQQKKEE